MYTRTTVVILFLLSLFSVKALFANLTEPASGAEQVSFDGYWESKGYGYLFSASGNNFQLFNSTKISRLVFAEGQINNNQIELPNFGSMLIFRLGDSLGVQLPNDKKIFLSRIDSLPNQIVSEYTNDPEANFEVFWNTFEEECILFQLTTTNWKALYNKYRPMVNKNTTDAELFNIFCEMLKPLKDSHTSIIDPFNMNSYSPRLDEHDWWIVKKDKIVDVIKTYLDGKKIESAGNGHVLCGKINQNIGYLNFDQFCEYAEGVPYYEDAAFYKSVIDSLIIKYQDCKAIVLDIRCNVGGYDQFALDLASRFNDKERISHYKQVRTGGYSEYSEPDPVILPVNSINYIGKPVIVLTSGFTVSAADVCALAFRQIPGITIIGENTRGMFSDKLAKTLPNGWELSLSNERYTNPEGVFLEQTGVTPDIYIKGDSSSFIEGRDLMLEKAIQTLNQLTKVEKGKKENLTYKLGQNFPNPFNPSTTIKYQLPVSGHAEIKVYNILGNEVSTLLNEQKEAGYHQVVFNGNNLSNGVYFYRLQSGSFSQTRKFILMK